MNQYCGQALEYLKLAFDPQRALFSYSTSVDETGRVVNDFRMPASLRYTINTYLGLGEALRHGYSVDWLGDLTDRVAEFLALHEHLLNSSADRGLLLVLLADTNPSHPAIERSLDRIEQAITGENRCTGSICRISPGCSGARRLRRITRGVDAVQAVVDLIRTHYVHLTSGLARHSLARYRAHTVSFGNTVYFLRSLYEYSEAFGIRQHVSCFPPACGVYRDPSSRRRLAVDDRRPHGPAVRYLSDLHRSPGQYGDAFPVTGREVRYPRCKGCDQAQLAVELRR